MVNLKLYELKKGDRILVEGEILEFVEIRGEKAVFYNGWGVEYEYEDFLFVEEIGEIVSDSNSHEDCSTPSLF